jgi:YVTN family beta-propeller protein
VGSDEYALLRSRLSRRAAIKLGLAGGVASVVGLPASMLAGRGILPVAAATVPTPSSTPLGSRVTFDAVYVVNGGDGMNGSLTVINAENNTVAGTIALNNAMWPHHIYMSADRSRLLVAVPGMDMSMGHANMPPATMPGAVMQLDARTGATINAVLLPMMNHNAIFSPNQREIWTSQMMMGGSVLVLDPGTLATLQTINVGDMPAEVTFSPDGSLGWVANTMSNNVSVIDVRTKAVVNTIAVGVTPVGPWQADNGFVYVDDETSQQVSAISRRSQSVRFTINLGFTPGMAKLGPDGNLWVTDETNGQVVLFDATRTNRVGQIATGMGAHGLTFSGGGSTAYVTNQMENTLSVIDVERRAVKATLPTGTKPNGLIWRDDEAEDF